MGIGLLAGRLVLAAVFAVAGAAKLLDRAGTRQALAGFEIPSRLTGPLAAGLPVVELAVGAALVGRVSAWWGALAALGLLVTFTAVIGRSLARGGRPDCRCFGQLRAAPVGWPTLVRNVTLGAMAAVLVAAGGRDPGPSVLSWLDPLPPAEHVLALLGLVAIALLAGVAAMLGYLLTQHARVLSRLDAIEARLEDGIAAPVEREDAHPPDKGLPIGAPAPAFELPALAGASQTPTALIAPGRPVLLLFVSPGCEPCAPLVPEIARWQREHADTFTLTVVSSGSAADNRSKFGMLDPERLLLQTDGEAADAYAARWTPAGLLLGRTGRIASAVAYGDEAIRALVAHTVARPGVPYLGPAEGHGARGHGPLRLVGGVPRPGDPAPPIALPDLEGRTVELGDYRGRDTLVLFWQPNCPFCQQLAEDLRRWEAEPPRAAPRLLLISSGSVEANRALGLQSSILLDEGFTAGKAFGARGTPSAVLVDAEGRIASTVGVGSRDVLALAGVVPIVDSPRRGPSAA